MYMYVCIHVVHILTLLQDCVTEKTFRNSTGRARLGRCIIPHSVSYVVLLGMHGNYMYYMLWSQPHPVTLHAMCIHCRFSCSSGEVMECTLFDVWVQLNMPRLAGSLCGWGLVLVVMEVHM